MQHYVLVQLVLLLFLKIIKCRVTTPIYQLLQYGDEIWENGAAVNSRL